MASPRRPMATIFLTVFLDLLGFGMVIPILPLYAKQFGVSDVTVTTILGSSYSLMQLFFAPLWGRVSDRRGRRPVLLLSIAGSSLSQLGYALAPGFVPLVLARMLAGICGANISAAQAYIADVTDEKSRAAGMGLLGMALGLGFVLGPFFGGVLSGYFGDRVPFFVASALAAVNFVLAYAILVEPQRRLTGARSATWAALGRAVATPRIRTLIILFFVLTFGFSMLEQTFPFYLQRRFHWEHQHVGYVFAYLGLVMIVTQGLIVRRAVRAIGERWLVVIGTALLAAGMLVQWIGDTWQVLGGAVTLVALGNGLTNPSLTSLVSRAAGGDRQGGVLGVSQSSSALARIVGPLVGGAFLAVGEATPMLVGAIVIAFACAFAAAFVQPPEPIALALGEPSPQSAAD